LLQNSVISGEAMLGDVVVDVAVEGESDPDINVK
jgi:hypothetical protein